MDSRILSQHKIHPYAYHVKGVCTCVCVRVRVTAGVGKAEILRGTLDKSHSSKSYFKVKILERLRRAWAGVHLLLLCSAAYDFQVLESVEVSPVFRPGLNQQKPYKAGGRFRHALLRKLFIYFV